ncbi:MAG: MoaD/ThiS family protein [Methanobrevibacter sp.]|nr:MoaD/ThiS family protein [Methanobrevibacter sp.]
MTSQNYTIKDLILELGLSAQTVVAKQNGELVIEDTLINDGDEIQLIQIIYGG